VGVLALGQIQAAGKKGKGKGKAKRDGAGAPAANGAPALQDAAPDGLRATSSGVAEALAKGLQDAETAPRLADDGDGDDAAAPASKED
jgi:hypothetical protein